MTLTYYGNDYIEIGLAVDRTQNAYTATTYTKTEVDVMRATKASTSYVGSSVASVLSRNHIDGQLASQRQYSHCKYRLYELWNNGNLKNGSSVKAA